MPWYNTAWSYRLPVTVTNGSSTSALSYAQVSVTLTGSAYASFSAHAKPDGSDIVVTDSDAVTPLPFALEEIDTTNSVVYLLVNLSLAANSSKTIYVYYGNASASSQSSYATTIGPATAATLNVDILTQAQVSGYNSNPSLICLKNQTGGNASRNGMLLAFHMRAGGENGGSNARLGLLSCAPGADPRQAANWSNTALCTPASGYGFSPIMATELASGTILVLYEYDTNARLDAAKGQFYIGKSTDGGQTWTNLPANAGTSPPANPLTLPTGAVYGTTVGLYWASFVELTAGGDLLATWYGYISPQTTTSVHLMKCPSGLDPSVGSHWQDTGVTIAYDGTNLFSNSTICLTSSGNLICAMRNDYSGSGGGDLWVSRSTNSGATWSTPAALGLPAVQSPTVGAGAVTPNFLKLQSGNLLLSWGNRNKINSPLLGSYCLLSTDGGQSWFDRSVAGSCEVSQGGAFISDFGWPSVAQLPGGNIVSLCYRGIQANAQTNIVCSVFDENWVVNSPNVLENCQSLSNWLSIGANTALDATHTFGQATAIKCSNNNTSAVMARRQVLAIKAKAVQNFAIAIWHYPSQIGSSSYLGHIIADFAVAAVRMGLYATGSATAPNTTGELQWWNGSAYQDTSKAVLLNQWNRVDIARLNTTLSTVSGSLLANAGAAYNSLGQYQSGGNPAQLEFTAATGSSVNTTTWLGLLYSHQCLPALPTLSVGSEQTQGVTGTLRVQNQWTTQTAASVNALSGQSQASFGFRWMCNTAIPAGFGGQNMLLIPASGAIVSIVMRGSPGLFFVSVHGTTGSLTYSLQGSPGVAHSIVCSWGSSQQTLYVDSVQVAQITNGGNLATAAGPIQLGSTGNLPDYNIQDLFYINGTALSQSDVSALYYLHKTPGTLTPAATAWWTLTGTIGATASPTTDAGFLDQIGGTIRFTAPAGSGKGTYSAANLGPFTVTEAHTGMGDPVTSTAQTIFVTAPVVGPILTVPTLTVNGNPVSLVVGVIDQDEITNAWGTYWSFKLADPTINLTPTDVIFITAPDGWVASFLGFSSMPVRNSVGQCEYSIPARPTLGLGFCMSGQTVPGEYVCFAANQYRRARWAGVSAFDANGYPSQLTGGASGIGTLTWDTQWPYAGIWTFGFDLGNSTTSFALNPNGHNPPVYRPDLSNPGVGGIGVRQVYQFDWNTIPVGQLRESVAGRPSINNLQIVPYGGSPSSDPYALDPWMLQQLTVTGSFGPAIIRVLGINTANGQSSIALPTDLVDPSTPSWNKTTAIRNVTVTSVRTWDTTVSPNCVTIYGPLPIPGGRFLIAGNGVSAIVEVVAAAHGLYTGQQVTLNLGLGSTPLATQQGTSITMPDGLAEMVFVTSANTFLVRVFPTATPLPSGQDYTVLSGETTTPSGSLTIDPQVGYKFYPFEFSASIPGRFAQCIYWIIIPIEAIDDCVNEIIRRTLAVLPPGVKIVVELSNEIWNGGFAYPQNVLAVAMSRLLGGGGISSLYAMRRALEVGQLFKAAWTAAGRPTSEVISLLSSQFGYTSKEVNAAISEYHRTGNTFDAMSVALYLNRDWGSSITGWSMNQMFDLNRHHVAIGRYFGYSFDEFHANVARYESTIGKRILHLAYEGGWEGTIMPASIAPDWNWTQAPARYSLEQMLFVRTQNEGFDYFAYSAYTLPANLHAMWLFQGQLAGQGTSNVLNGGVVYTNEAPGALAWQDWLIAYWAAPPPPGGNTYNLSVVTSLGLSGASSIATTRVLTVSASLGLSASPTIVPSGAQTYHLTVSSTLGVSPSLLVSASITTNLGRHRLGDTLTMSLLLPGASVPVVNITSPTGTQTTTLVTTDGVLYTATQLLAGDYNSNPYVASVQLGVYTFEVVAGGDTSGGTLAFLATQGHAGWQVIVQLQGSRPATGILDTTP